MSMENDEISFEDAYRRLEEIVNTLETGDNTLEQSMALFEEGMNLTKICGNLLNNVELRITRLENTYNDRSDDSED